MPLYEYQCLTNGHRFEVRQNMSDDPVAVCQICGEPVRRVIQPVGIVFKGSGFYVNDSKKSSNPASKPADTTKPAVESSSDSAAASASTDAAKPESKADTKAESKAAS